jgi:hypothetical protein
MPTPVKPGAMGPEAAAAGIRLKPSSSDYATFVKTTAAVLGITGPPARKTKPNERVLWLANLDS